MRSVVVLWVTLYGVSDKAAVVQGSLQHGSHIGIGVIAWLEEAAAKVVNARRGFDVGENVIVSGDGVPTVLGPAPYL